MAFSILLADPVSHAKIFSTQSSVLAIMLSIYRPNKVSTKMIRALFTPLREGILPVIYRKPTAALGTSLRSKDHSTVLWVLVKADP